MKDRFIQIHTLTPYAGVLLNRDDAGYAKRLEYGGRTRTRVSSQCLKRHWRTFDGEYALQRIDDVEMSVRSRHSVRLYVAEPLEESHDPALVDTVVRAVMTAVVGKPESKDQIQTGQIVVLGRPELRYIESICRDILEADAVQEAADDKARAAAIKNDLKARLKRDFKKNLQALGNAAGLDAALFGRMTTSDILARGDAAIHVAHAFTVHEESSEDDFFSAIDDLLDQVADDQQGLGSGHIGNTELTSGLFYSYVVVDVPLLLSNLTGKDPDAEPVDGALAAEVVRRLVRTIATVSPGAKLGSTAPYAHAHAMLVESGSAQPRSLAAAFERPVPKHDALANAYRSMAVHAAEMDRMYDDMVPERCLAAVHLPDGVADRLKVREPVSIRALADWAAARVQA